uniref:Uncharacterized protein n=2 Tax=Clytia hemisphaerica TaxID=252671 RepID=A0A7M5V265_9CNID
MAKKKKTRKCPTTECPFCGKEQTNLKSHAMRKHGLTEENALAMKSQYNLYNERIIKSDDDRKSKRRIHQRRTCPVLGCSKTPKRLNNHLRQTHKIKKKELFDRLMKKSELVENFDSEDSEVENEDESGSEEESDYVAFKNIIEKERDYLATIDSNSDSDSDCDWLLETTRRWNAKKDKLKEKRSREENKENRSPDYSESCSSTNDRALLKKDMLPEKDKLEEKRSREENKENKSPEYSESSSSSDEENHHTKKTLSNTAHDYESDQDLFDPYDEKDNQVKNVPNIDDDDELSDIYEEDPAISKTDNTECEDEDDEDDDAEPILFVPWKTSVFDDFKSWIQSPDGGLKKQRQAEQHKNQVMVILRDASEHTFEIKKLFDRKAIRDNWLVVFEHKRAPGTTKSYLYSLRFFYKFIQTDHPPGLKEFEDKCQEMKNIMDGWITVYRKHQKERQWVNEVKQLQEMITADDINKFDESSQVKASRKVLASKHVQAHISMTNFVSGRDYLLTSLCLDNASRSGALANMTLEEFKKGSVVEGSYNISVIDHKTLDTSGPCVIALEDDLYKALKIYIKYFRNKLEGINRSKTSPVFVSWSGNKMSSSMVTGQIKSYWSKCVGLTANKPTFSTTKVRKFAVTKTYEERPDLKKDVAMLMCHSEKTAAKSYYLQEKNKNASKTSKMLHALMRSKPSSSENNAKEDVEKVPEEKDGKMLEKNVEKVRKEKDEKIPEKNVGKMSEKNDEISDLSSETEDSVGSDEDSVESDEDSDFEDRKRGGKTTGRADFTISENNEINKIFKDWIQTTVVIRRADIGMMCEKKCSEMLKKYGDYKMTEKIRKERTKFQKNN